MLWLQGCPLRCPGCFNDEFQPFVGGERILVSDVAAKILETVSIEGVTYSGGEPMMQAEALCTLTETLREHGMTVMCYSGFTLQELHEMSDAAVERLIQQLDILVDGPFVAAKRASLLWRGSSNQRVHFLSDAYRSWRQVAEAPIAALEFSVSRNGYTAIGIPPARLSDRLDMESWAS